MAFDCLAMGCFFLGLAGYMIYHGDFPEFAKSHPFANSRTLYYINISIFIIIGLSSLAQGFPDYIPINSDYPITENRHETNPWVFLIFINTPAYIALGRIFFGTWSGFFESLYFLCSPLFMSIWRGEFFDDLWHRLKLLLFYLACASIVFLEYALFFK